MSAMDPLPVAANITPRLQYYRGGQYVLRNSFLSDIQLAASFYDAVPGAPSAGPFTKRYR